MSVFDLMRAATDRFVSILSDRDVDDAMLEVASGSGSLADGRSTPGDGTSNPGVNCTCCCN